MTRAKPLRKILRFRCIAEVTLEQATEHWRGFEWDAGPVCVINKGHQWGVPQVWAASAEEGKRVIRHAGALAGKTVIAMANGLEKVDREFRAVLPPEGSLAQAQQAAAPEARVVAAFHLIPAAALGATDLVDASAGDPVKEVRRLTDKRGVDFAYEAVGLSVTFDQAVRMLAREGVATLIGVMLALYSAMQFLFSPVLGVLSDRYGRRPVLLLSLAGAAIDYLVMAFAPELWMLVIGRAVAGITSAGRPLPLSYAERGSTIMRPLISMCRAWQNHWQ